MDVPDADAARIASTRFGLSFTRALRERMIFRSAGAADSPPASDPDTAAGEDGL